MTQKTLTQQTIQFFQAMSSDFVEQRKKQYESVWNTGTMRERIFRNDRFFTKLKDADLQFSAEMQKWVRAYITRGDLEVSDMKDLVLYLKTHNLRLSERENFLAAFIAIFGVVLLLRQLDLSTAPSFVGPSLVFIAIFGSILVLIERSNMKEMNTFTRSS
jgi:hypothetical protein